MDAQNLLALLLLNRTPGLTLRFLRPLLEEGRTPAGILEEILDGIHPVWKDPVEETRKIFDAGRELEEVQTKGFRLIAWGDPDYSYLLSEISDPPLVLYLKGNLEESDQAAVAVVGSRHPGLYGTEQAKRFGRELAESGLTVISGLARGIDRSAHEGALQISHGRTLAVMGSGLDVIYPKENRDLYDKISGQGAILSEFALGTPPLAENFPKRNRIIAGLSLGVIVMEAHFRSGSLITAHLAAEEGREVFALPGRVDQLGSRGTHRLIREGALLVESPHEVLEVLAPQLRPLGTPPAEASAPPEEISFLGLFHEKPLSFEEILQLGSLKPSEAAHSLTRLEIQGWLQKRMDGRYEPGRRLKGAAA